MTIIPEKDIADLPNAISAYELAKLFNRAKFEYAYNPEYGHFTVNFEKREFQDATLPESVKAILPVIGQLPDIREAIIAESSEAFFKAYPPADLASAFIALSNSDLSVRAGKAPSLVLFDVADVASRHGAHEFMRELFKQGYKPDEGVSRNLVFNAMLRKDPEMLGVLKDKFGEQTIRDMGELYVGFSGEREAITFSAAEIGAELDKMTPKLHDLSPTDKARVLGLEAQLLRADGAVGKVNLDGVLSKDEYEVIRSTIREQSIDSLASLTIGAVEQRVAAALDGNPNANLPKEKPPTTDKAASPTP